MSWFNASESLPTKDIVKLLQEMAESGDSAQASFAEYINDISKNFGTGPATSAQERIEHLRDCAEEMIKSAKCFLEKTRDRPVLSHVWAGSFGRTDMR